MSAEIPNKPEFLYKFRSLDQGSINYTLDVIRRKSLWFSKPLDFNDPFDCVPIVSSAASDAEFKSYIDELFKKYNPAMPREQRRANISEIMRDPKRRHDSAHVREMIKDTVDRAVNKAGVLSLTARCDHVLMWSHYASSHSGICLKFKLRQASWFKNAQQVIYSTGRPTMNIIKDGPMEQQRKAILHKADFWAYEEEWRVIDHIMGSGSHDFDPLDLEGVIFGKKTSDKNKALVIEALSAFPKSVELLQSDIDPEKYRLIFKPAS